MSRVFVVFQSYWVVPFKATESFWPSSVQSLSQRKLDEEPQRGLEFLPFKARHNGNMMRSHIEVLDYFRAKPIVMRTVQKLPNIKELAMKSNCVSRHDEDPIMMKRQNHVRLETNLGHLAHHFPIALKQAVDVFREED
ncbi:hypothetical protein SLA2020_263780 [Shorea laevis]